MRQRTVYKEGHDGSAFWLDEVKYVPGLSQNLFSVALGIAQDLVMGTTKMVSMFPSNFQSEKIV
jgi:hypothetical protein